MTRGDYVVVYVGLGLVISTVATSDFGRGEIAATGSCFSSKAAISETLPRAREAFASTREREPRLLGALGTTDSANAICAVARSLPRLTRGRVRSRIGVGFQGFESGWETHRLPCRRRDDLERQSARVWEKEQLGTDIGEVRP